MLHDNDDAVVLRMIYVVDNVNNDANRDDRDADELLMKREQSVTTKLTGMLMMIMNLRLLRQ